MREAKWLLWSDASGGKGKVSFLPGGAGTSCPAEDAEQPSHLTTTLPSCPLIGCEYDPRDAQGESGIEPPQAKVAEAAWPEMVAARARRWWAVGVCEGGVEVEV